MAIRHRQFDLIGLQFHPESILTEHGAKLIQNWLQN
jgi:anthranilate synthase component 2